MNKIKITILILILGLGIVFTSCDKNFDELNTNKTAINSLDPVPMLNHAIWKSSPAFNRHTMVYEMAIIQQMITPFGTSLAGGNYNQENFEVAQNTWRNIYPNVLRNTMDVIANNKDNATRSNICNMARIINSLGGMVLTDTYGDVPYSEAGLGFLNGMYTPVYDSQEAIYKSILNDLEAATTALNSTVRIETGDILYAGDINKWKRFGNSLMLRAAMRLCKVNPILAKEYVKKAVAAGVMTSNDDNAIVRHSANFPNDIGANLNGSEAANFFMAKPLVDFLKSNNDPRLAVLAVRFVGATSGSTQTDAVATRIPSNQIGIPVGFDNNSISARAVADGVGSFYGYTQFDRKTIGKQDSPFFLVTYAQTQFLLAEAVKRGWVDGDAQVYYSKGIKGHMEQLAVHDINLKINPNDIDIYLQAHPLETAKALEQINTQYWIACIMDGQEAFANFRRSGYPALAPNTYPQRAIADGFISRMTYDRSEFTNNLTNINNAITRQGPDKLDTRVWWDVK